MQMFSNTQIYGDPIVPISTMKLRECCVIIIGSTCQICGRNFKCVTDVALHVRWRHNMISEVVSNNPLMNLYENIDRKCDLYDEYFETASELKSHKRRMHKKPVLDRKRSRKLRLIIKIGGVTMTEMQLNRKYLKMHVGTQSDCSLENKSRQDDCATNIDLSLADHNVDNSRIHCVQPHKATNRYIVGKFEYTGDDSIAYNIEASERSLVEISNTPNRDVSFGADNGSSEIYESCREIVFSQKDTTNTFVDITNVDDKENSQGTNEQKRKSSNSSTEDILILKEKKDVYCLNDILDNQREGAACQISKLNKTTSISKSNSWFNENSYDIRQSNEGVRNKVISKSTNSFAEPLEIIIDNESDDEDTRERCSSTSLTRLSGKEKSSKDNSTYDDEVQEVLRIIRGQMQDINHESPNRMEREILLNTVKKMHIPTSQREVFSLDKNEAIFMANNNIDLIDCLPHKTIANNNYQCPANMNKLLNKSFDKKLSIYLNNNNLHRYDSVCYNNLFEINNNS